MITELMIILIVVGTIIVFVVWTSTRRRKRSEQDQRDVEDSTAQFKKDLEKTANEIIGRMENQAAHLESLLDDSERSRTQLEGRVAELRKLLKRSDGQSTEIKDLLVRLDEAVDDVDAMQKQMDIVERKINSAMNAQLPLQQQMMNMQPMLAAPMMNQMLQPQQQVAQIPQTTSMPKRQQSPISPPQMMRTAPARAQDNFAQVLEQSVASKIPPARLARSPILTQRGVAQQQQQPAQQSNADSAKLAAIRQSLNKASAKVAAQTRNANAAGRNSADIRRSAVSAIKTAAENAGRNNNPASARKTPAPKQTQQHENATVQAEVATDSLTIRDMLLSGMSVEDIARETGLGRGAVELVQQMIRHQLERR